MFVMKLDKNFLRSMIFYRMIIKALTLYSDPNFDKDEPSETA